MSLETVTHIADLVRTNPTATDPISQGDNHLQNLKIALTNDFAGFTGAVLVTGTDGGAADVYTLTPTQALVAYSTKMLIEFTPNATNLTTTPTLNISGLGAKTIKSVANAALVAGDLVISTPMLATYDGTSVRLVGPTKNYMDQLALSAALPAGALGFLRNDGAGASAFTQTHTGYAQKEVKGSDIACAATIDLTAATGNLVHITGSTGPVTAITVASGAEYTIVWDSTPSVTHHATTLILPGGANITVAAGDVWKVRGDGSGNARVVSVEKADGSAITGMGRVLATISPTAAANIDFLTTFTATYDNYRVVCEGLIHSGGAASENLLLRVANAGAVDTAANYTSGGTSITLMSMWGAGKGGTAVFDLCNVNSASTMKLLVGAWAVQTNAVPNYSSSDLNQLYIGGAISGLRLFWNTGGNFTAQGVIRVYGYNNS